MVAVVVIAAAVAAAQLYQSEKARGASAKRLKELEAEFDALVPPEYDLSPMDPPDYITASIPEPSYDFTAITPEQFKIIGKYTPEAAPLILEQKPELIKETGAAREGRDAELAALRKLRSISAADKDPELMQAMDEAAQASQIEAQSRSQSVLQDAARRGTLDAGTTLAAQLQGSSDAMESAAGASRDAAVAAHRNKLQALRDSATLGGKIRGDDLDLEARNTSIINDFNQRTSRNKQNWSNDRANMLNDAERYNLGEEQRIADTNTSMLNDARYRERDRADDLKTRLHGMRVDERGYQNSIKDKYAGWKRDERDRADRLRQTGFDNKMNIAAGKQGLGFKEIDMNYQTAQDRNAAIQGVGNAATSGYMYSNRKKKPKDEPDQLSDDGDYEWSSSYA